MENQQSATSSNTPVTSSVETAMEAEIKTNSLKFVLVAVVISALTFGTGGYYLGKQQSSKMIEPDKEASQETILTPQPTLVIEENSTKTLPTNPPNQENSNELVYSEDVKLTKLNSKETQLTNIRSKFSFQFDPTKQYVLECPNINEFNDNTPYFIFELTDKPIQTDCGFGGGEAFVYVSFKQYFENSSKQPTIELTKKQLLSEGYKITEETQIAISNIKGIRLKAVLTSKETPLPSQIDTLYFEYNNGLYTLSPSVLQPKYNFQFLN